MMPILDEVPFGARVAIIRLRSLGDCVLSTPALALLKAGRPDLRIAVVADPVWAEVYHDNPDVEVVLPPELGSFRKWQPRLVLNLHGGTTSARLTALSGASWRAGFAHFRNQFIYNVKIPRAQEILGMERCVHTAEHAASAMFALGVAQQQIPRAKVVAPQTCKDRSYAVIHPFASEAAKTWSCAGFLKAAEFIRSEEGLEPLFIGAQSDDLSAFRKFSIAHGRSLTETKAVIAGASLFLGNDSGPAHLAAAFGIPTVVLFGPSDPDIWGPWRTESRIVRAQPIDGITHQQANQAIAALTGAKVHA